jgi:hypothetical protein
MLFQSKDYGVGDKNQLDVRVMGRDVQLWIKDGDRNAIICMDKEDWEKFHKAAAKAAKVAPETVARARDYTPSPQKKVSTTSEENGIVKKQRKPRSDKGKKRATNRKGGNDNV